MFGYTLRDCNQHILADVAWIFFCTSDIEATTPFVVATADSSMDIEI